MAIDITFIFITLASISGWILFFYTVFKLSSLRKQETELVQEILKEIKTIKEELPIK